jgi:GT2 family glycosyltransferase
MKSTLKDVSIVIVTYKGDELTRNCLDSLAATCGDDPQIVVVDNSPSEATRLMVASYPNTTYVSSPGNPGFAGGNNRAMPECNRPYVLLLNNDTIVHTRESIECLVEFLDDHPKCGAAQGTMVLPGKTGNRLCSCGSFLTPFGFMHYPGVKGCNAADVYNPFRCFSGIGAFLIFRRKIIQCVGDMLFRTHFWSYYEETDFCHRVWLSGSEVWYVPTPPIDHLCGRTAGKFSHEKIMRRFLRNQFFSLSANLGFASRLLMLPSLALAVVVYGLSKTLKGDTVMLVSGLGAIKDVLRDRKRVLAARRQIRRIRKASDRQIFRFAMKLPSLAYLMHARR